MLRRAFTLVEILVVLGVIAILAAILLPMLSKTREAGRRTRCISNLSQIYSAVRLYKDDEGRYPPSVAPLLPPNTTLVTSTGTEPPMWPGLDAMDLGSSGSSDALPGTLTGGGVTVISDNGRGYLKTFDMLRCPDDNTQSLTKLSSYDTSGASVWNAWGYYFMGLATGKSPASAPIPALCINPGAPYDPATNPVAKSLANRFAPPSTIITHCRFHRTQTSNLSANDDLYTSHDNGAGSGAFDVILRLDGTIKAENVSTWAQTSASQPLSQWQLQK